MIATTMTPLVGAPSRSFTWDPADTVRDASTSRSYLDRYYGGLPTAEQRKLLLRSNFNVDG